MAEVLRHQQEQARLEPSREAPPDQACDQTAGRRGLQPGDRLDIVVPEERPTAVVQGCDQVCTLASESLRRIVVLRAKRFVSGSEKPNRVGGTSGIMTLSRRRWETRLAP